MTKNKLKYLIQGKDFSGEEPFLHRVSGTVDSKGTLKKIVFIELCLR